MAKKTFFCRLLPPRPTFARDMSPAEAKAMQDHGLYWRECMARGHVVVFGLVADPAAAFGIVVVEVADEDEARRMTANDPAILAELGLRYDIQPMPFGAVYPPKGTAERA
jgi:YCII-related domain-containing protein